MRGGIFAADDRARTRPASGSRPSRRWRAPTSPARSRPAEPVELDGDGPPRRRARHRDQALDHPPVPRARRAARRCCPARRRPTEVLARDPDLVFLANGPGDPAALDYVVEHGARAGRQAAGRRASASATSCSAGRSGSRPSSCPSATAAPTTRSRTSRRAGSTSPPRTTASRCRPPDGGETIEADEPVRWETDFGAAELSHLNLYDRTVEGLALRDVAGLHGPVPPRGRARPARRPLPLRPLPGAGRGRLMPRRDDIEKILLIGSGPIVIGQAAEFDYSGVQACKVLLEEGYEVVLVNSNPATIMTDPEFATAPTSSRCAGAGRPDHRARAPRRAAADARRPDGAQPGARRCTTTARSSASASS